MGHRTLAATSTTPSNRDAARRAFELFASTRSPHRRAMAYAALGAVQLAGSSEAAARLLHTAVDIVGAAEAAITRQWCWPESRFTYDNAVLPLSMLAASTALGRPDVQATGLEWLRFLIARQLHDGHLSPIPSAGAGPDENEPPAFDQQPVELANLAAAARLAHRVSGEASFGAVPELCARWFLGNNDHGIALYDPDDGSCCDGLTADGLNSNRGAESTIAANLTLLHAAAADPTRPSPSSASR